MIDTYRMFRPRFWTMNNPYSAAWDALILDAMEKGNVKRETQFRARFNDRSVWVWDYPHRYGTPYDGYIRPSCRTIDMMVEYLAMVAD